MTDARDSTPITTHPHHHHVRRAALRRAYPDRDADGLAALYADDATIESSTPSTRRAPRGRPAAKPSSPTSRTSSRRDMTHEVEPSPPATALGYSLRCPYADGTKVVCAATAKLRDGRDRPRARRAGLGLLPTLTRMTVA